MKREKALLISLSNTKTIHNTCNNWSKKYNEAYNTWLKLPEQEKKKMMSGKKRYYISH